jgi:RNA polymerase sigma-B factor
VPTGRAGPGAGGDDAEFVAYRAAPSRALRNQLVEANQGVVEYHVRRFSRSAGIAVDDLRQTALVALIKAVERYDPARGASFRTFAARTIEGELKRHLRDRAWSVRPPRRAQELHLRAQRAADELVNRFGRAPTLDEVAAELGVDRERLLEAQEAGRARTAAALDAVGPSGDPNSSLSRLLGAIDPELGAVEEQLVLHDAIGELGEREQVVLRLRFVEELSQPEIAAEIGVSQSYVSRLLRSTLEQLRHDLAVG